MFKLIVAVLALVVVATAQSTEDTCPGDYCYFIDGSLFAYLNISREACNDMWNYKLVKPLENGSEFIIGSGSFYYYYWTVSNTFGAGTGFVVYFTLNEIYVKHHYNELTFKYSTLQIPTMAPQPYKFDQKFSKTMNDTCKTNDELKKQCHYPLDFDYDFAESEDSFYNLQGYVPGESPALKPYVSEDNCVYIINQADSTHPRHLAPVLCYDPLLHVCQSGNPLVVRSRSGYSIEVPLDYTSTLNSVTIQIDDELSIDLEFNYPWVQVPSVDRTSFAAGFTVVTTLYNSNGFVNTLSLSQVFNYPLCGSSSSSCSSNHHQASSWESSFDTSFFTSFTSFTSFFFSSFTSFSSWDSSSTWTSFSSSSSSWTSDRSSNESDDDSIVFVWLFGSVFSVLTIVVVLAIVGVLVYFKKSQYRPLVAGSDGEGYYPTKGAIN